MVKLRAALAVASAIATLGVAGAAAAATIGVNEDATKIDASLFAGLADVGLRQNILSVAWTQDQGLSSGQQAAIGNAIQAAQARGIKVILTVYPATGNASKLGDPSNTSEFVSFAVNALKSFPQVRSVIVGNEPNRTLFMSPVNGAAYARILAAAYDAIKDVDAGIQVIGVGLSPRGSGDGSSLFPPQFVKQMGDWYRQSGRTKPLMDAFSFHPYPFPVTKAPDKASDWPTVGMADLYRLKQAIWDAFNSTGQPTVEDGLKLDLDEVAYQVPTDGKSGYTGSENVETVSEDTQASYYQALVNMVACDPSIETLNFFHFVDEANRAGFQSGFLDVAKTQRPVYGAVKAAIASTAGGSSCTGAGVEWAHATGVMGFRADLGAVKPAYPSGISSLLVKLRVEEESAVAVRLIGAGDKVVATVTRELPAGPQAQPDALATVQLRFPPLRQGTYTVRVSATAAMNDKRTSSATSEPFQVGGVQGRHGRGHGAGHGTRRRHDVGHRGGRGHGEGHGRGRGHGESHGGGRSSQGCRGALPNVAKVVCTGGAPTIEACRQGYADGDHQVANGCEIDLLSDPDNCGRVGAKVPAEYACVHGLAVREKHGNG